MLGSNIEQFKPIYNSDKAQCISPFQWWSFDVCVHTGYNSTYIRWILEWVHFRFCVDPCIKVSSPSWSDAVGDRWRDKGGWGETFANMHAQLVCKQVFIAARGLHLSNCTGLFLTAERKATSAIHWHLRLHGKTETVLASSRENLDQVECWALREE